MIRLSVKDPDPGAYEARERSRLRIRFTEWITVDRLRLVGVHGIGMLRLICHLLRLYQDQIRGEFEPQLAFNAGMYWTNQPS